MITTQANKCPKCPQLTPVHRRGYYQPRTEPHRILRLQCQSCGTTYGPDVRTDTHRFTTVPLSSDSYLLFDRTGELIAELKMNPENNLSAFHLETIRQAPELRVEHARVVSNLGGAEKLSELSLALDTISKLIRG